MVPTSPCCSAFPALTPSPLLFLSSFVVGRVGDVFVLLLLSMLVAFDAVFSVDFGLLSIAKVAVTS
jgi:hypothetical protein